MLTDQLFGCSHDTMLLHINIRKIFDSYSDVLFDKRRKIGEEIFNWGQSIISQVKEYIDKQNRLLDQEYENQRYYLEKTRQEYINEAVVYKKKKSNERIHQLIATCNTLKLELAAFQYPTRTIPYLTVITQENLAHEQLRSRSKESHENDKINRVRTIENSSLKATTTNIKQKSQRSLITEPSNEKSQSTIYRDDLVKECPICSMVFSSNMAPDDRSAHINEHFSDD